MICSKCFLIVKLATCLCHEIVITDFNIAKLTPKMDKENHLKAYTAKEDQKRYISYINKKKKVLLLAFVSVLVLLIVVSVVIVSLRNTSPQFDETEQSNVVLSVEKSGNKKITHDNSNEINQLFRRQINENPSDMTENEINENRLDGTIRIFVYHQHKV